MDCGAGLKAPRDCSQAPWQPRGISKEDRAAAVEACMNGILLMWMEQVWPDLREARFASSGPHEGLDMYQTFLEVGAGNQAPNPPTAYEVALVTSILTMAGERKEGDVESIPPARVREVMKVWRVSGANMGLVMKRLGTT